MTDQSRDEILNNMRLEPVAISCILLLSAGCLSGRQTAEDDIFRPGSTGPGLAAESMARIQEQQHSGMNPKDLRHASGFAAGSEKKLLQLLAEG